MKVKCVRLLDQDGNVTSSDAWLSVGQVYHVLSTFIDPEGARSYALVSSQNDGEWPQMVSHMAECFEVVSKVIPANWRPWLHDSGGIGVSPVAWQTPGFSEDFFDHVPDTYPIFIRERDLILHEDP